MIKIQFDNLVVQIFVPFLKRDSYPVSQNWSELRWLICPEFIDREQLNLNELRPQIKNCETIWMDKFDGDSFPDIAIDTLQFLDANDLKISLHEYVNGIHFLFSELGHFGDLFELNWNGSLEWELVREHWDSIVQRVYGRSAIDSHTTPEVQTRLLNADLDATTMILDIDKMRRLKNHFELLFRHLFEGTISLAACGPYSLWLGHDFEELLRSDVEGNYRTMAQELARQKVASLKTADNFTQRAETDNAAKALAFLNRKGGVAPQAGDERAEPKRASRSAKSA